MSVDALKGASETLLIPLACRARGSRERGIADFADPESEALCEQLAVDLDRYAASRSSMLGVIHRGAFFDSRCIDFLQRHPDGTVLNLGAGLNTAYERVAATVPQGNWQWIDTDLAPVMKIRTDLFKEDDRRSNQVLDATDIQALTELLNSIDGPVLLNSEAVLIYTRPESVAAVFKAAADKGAEFVFDWVSPRMMHASRNHPAMKKLKDQSVVFCSSMRSARDIQNYDGRWKLIAQSSAPMTKAGVVSAFFAALYFVLSFGGRFYGCVHAVSR